MLMKLKNRIDFSELENEAERLVVSELEKQLEEVNDACTCNDCILDMAAYALNHVKPYYRTSLLGKLYANTIENTDYMQEISSAVSIAIEKISENPSHD